MLQCIEQSVAASVLIHRAAAHLVEQWIDCSKSGAVVVAAAAAAPVLAVLPTAAAQR
jgi:hypothetical protein